MRAFAVIAVVLNHLDLPYRYIPHMPAWFSNFFIKVIFQNGRIGVSIFFILSGFLMAYLYPNNLDRWHFVQKRYTRLIPAMITICSTYYIIFLTTLPWYLQILLIIGAAATVNILWVRVIKRQGKVYSRRIFFSYLVVQTVLFLFSVYLVSRQIQQVVSNPFFVELSNLTLTYPLIPNVYVIIGVYWTLVLEILFYLIYPSLSGPFYLAFKRGKKAMFVLLTLLIPVTYMIGGLLSQITSFDILQWTIFYFFFIGMTLGMLYKYKPEYVLSLTGRFTKVSLFMSLILFFALIICYQYLQVLNLWLFAVIQMFFAFPFALLVAFTLNPNDALSKIFSSKVLGFIGIISYSMYLVHIPVIKIVHSIYHSRNAITDIFFISITLVILIPLSYILYTLLEKPYFRKMDYSS